MNRSSETPMFAPVRSSVAPLRSGARISAEARTHLLVLAFIGLVTLALRLHPEWMRFMPGQSPLRMMFHINCPFCGMTRDFAGMLHGQAKTLNPSSWLVAFAIYCVYPLMFFWAWSRERLDVFRRPLTHRLVAVALVLMMVANNWRR